MSPVYVSYGRRVPVIWNEVFGNVSKLATRVSGSAHGDGGNVGSVVQFFKPVAPVVNSARSRRSSTGDIVWSSLSEKVVASNGATVSAGSFSSCANVTGSGGAKP